MDLGKNGPHPSTIYFWSLAPLQRGAVYLGDNRNILVAQPQAP
jgi:hypothetical protein